MTFNFDVLGVEYRASCIFRLSLPTKLQIPASSQTFFIRLLRQGLTIPNRPLFFLFFFLLVKVFSHVCITSTHSDLSLEPEL